MKKLKPLLLIISLILIFTSCSKTENNSLNNEKPTVAVAIVPEVTIVQKIAEDTVNVFPTIPKGASPSNYMPKPSEMINLENAKYYFSIGVNAETSNILPKIKSMKNPPKVIYLNKLINEKYPDRNFKNNSFITLEDSNSDEEHEHGGRDPHIWMSPKRFIMMVEIIKDNLIELMPENKDMYIKNADNYINEIKEADNYVKNNLKNIENKSFIIYHPSLGYFADEYGLNMISIEENGKETTPKGLKKIIDFAKKNNIKVVFHQVEIDSNQAKLIATEINGKTLSINPLSENYVENLKELSNTFVNNSER